MQGVWVANLLVFGKNGFRKKTIERPDQDDAQGAHVSPLKLFSATFLMLANKHFLILANKLTFRNKKLKNEFLVS